MSQMPWLSPGLWFTRHGHELGNDLHSGERKKPLGFKVYNGIGHPNVHIGLNYA